MRCLFQIADNELPELVNLLKGYMSLVGPRPLLIKYLPLYKEHQKRRHEVRPGGLSGLAQINGRNDISWQDKLDLDAHYVDNISFILDWIIIINTIVKVFALDGISKVGKTTTDPFLGSTNEEKIKQGIALKW